MSRQLYLQATPPEYPGVAFVNTFNRDAFTKKLDILAVKTSASKTGSILRAPEMRRAIMDLPRIRSVDVDPSDPQDNRLVLLRVSDKVELSPDALKYLETETKGLVPHTVTLGYDYWSADEIIRAVLPEHLRDGAPSGFAATGHIEYLPFKRLIGQIILDKNKKIKTVVNKLDSIDAQFRFFKMELIAGEPDFVVEHHETDCSFVFDFREVYWNSRLHTEHARLVDLFNHEDVIADVFAGVGPFAIPSAKKGCAVFANDLNPNSVKYLAQNVQSNNVSQLVKVSCEDGREFIRSVFRRSYDDPFPGSKGPLLSKTQQNLARRKKITPDSPSSELPPRRRVSHFVMNLPDSAITFLDAFRGVLASDEVDGLREAYDVMPMVHCHCFTRECEPDKAEADIRQRVEEKLGSKLTTEVSLHLVRSVAPNKEMYCISFRLPAEVALSSQ
ncbi:hypothetical protein DXG03_008425 [Asterophora parasitica]|uniref:tRNA (guanine(37)-N1)-methyltransferase n=1 Tax=Asterophora parasitica TaxID=117018 RepID=A0A9P7GBU6_9AGAR|nr:hypothetical protein DXG03_008425 [Asterophora parasitica]